MKKMCDLIDLKSPDTKSLLSSKLASPLIPVPANTGTSNCNNSINEPISLITSKRDSLENNPFDMVLHKTTEYIQKRDDPFEVALEKALKPKCKKINELRTNSFDFTDDHVKRKNHMQNLKMNKTLDELLIKKKLDQKTASTNKTSNENVINNDSNNVDTFNDNLEAVDVIPTINIQEIDLSILNQSVMNDTLFEIDKVHKNEMASILYNKTSMQTEKDNFNIGQTTSSDILLKTSRLQRSLSQGEPVSSKRSELFRHISLMEPSRTVSESGTGSSLNSLDFLNEGFLKSYYSQSSIFSGLSNVSSIPKLNSVSSSTNLSTFPSNDAINRAFLESCSSEKSENSEATKIVELGKEITSVTSVPTKYTISELSDQFDKLKAKVSEFSESSVDQKNEECCIENKLIDVDVFTPEGNSSKECYKSSISDTSSDSVFLEENKVNKSIFHEAKLLAKTFEELALKTSSGSSTDDLITSNPLWMSELLPAFDDEGMVDNLIELPTSPSANDTEPKDTKIKEYTNNENNEKTAKNVTKNIKELELELIEPVHAEKHITAATLLLELKKLINTENNPEANKLVENLEKVLGVNFENNTQLLTCLNATNNLAKSPQKSDSSLEVIQNIAKNNMEQSQEDNLSNDLNNDKESPVCKDMNIDHSNINKCTDSQKCLDKIDSESPKTDTEKTKKERNEKELNIQIECKEDSTEKESKNLLNEKVVIELLTNIGKLLTCQTKTHPTSDVLNNLGKVLNFASNDDNMEIQQTPKKSKLKLKDKTNFSIPSKSNRQSLNLESKKQSIQKNFIRRSISVSHTLTAKDTVPLTSSYKTECQLKAVKKRFPSDPCLVSPTSNKNKNIVTKSSTDVMKIETQTRTLTALDLRKEKTAIIHTVKNKLKKKIGTDIINKKGPLKAVLPIGTMQKKEAVNSKVTSSCATVTPPQPHKIVSSTPKSPRNECVAKKSSLSSKPVASSTPDAHNSKSQKVQSPHVVKKRNFSCDISPVSIRAKVENNNKINSSPKRKLPSPKKTTPKRRSVGSSIPKSQTPPLTKKLNSSFDVNQYGRPYESPQRLPYKISNSLKSSPVSLKKTERIQQSPLKESNKLMYKAKPVKLISKLQRHSVGTNIAEKENNYI